MTPATKVLIVVLSVICLILAFILGRLSVEYSANDNDIEIITTEDMRVAPKTPSGSLTSQNFKQDNNETESISSETIEIRASSRGSKYYYPWCASTFNEDNTIYFSSSEEAEASGYELATGCSPQI